MSARAETHPEEAQRLARSSAPRAEDGFGTYELAMDATGAWANARAIRVGQCRRCEVAYLWVTGRIEDRLCVHCRRPLTAVTRRRKPNNGWRWMR